MAASKLRIVSKGRSQRLRVGFERSGSAAVMVSGRNGTVGMSTYQWGYLDGPCAGCYAAELGTFYVSQRPRLVDGVSKDDTTRRGEGNLHGSASFMATLGSALECSLLASFSADVSWRSSLLDPCDLSDRKLKDLDLRVWATGLCVTGGVCLGGACLEGGCWCAGRYCCCCCCGGGGCWYWLGCPCCCCSCWYCCWCC